MAWKIVPTAKGIFLPQIGWHLDARFPVARSFVSHAHFDHLGDHAQVLCSEGTARLMQARMPGERQQIILPFGQPRDLTSSLRVTLHPAGHIFGSAQLRAETDDGSLLYTGDFKLRPGLSAERCETPRSDTLIMETTFGLPRYRFPPTDQALAAVVAFCRDTLDEGEVPVLFGYSLGKSQELLQGLAGAGLSVMLHPQTAKLTRVYEELGMQFPPWRDFVLDEVAGHAVVCPPQARDSSWLRKIRPRRCAMITGWAIDANATFRYRCDAAFPLSDHADYDDLLRFVEAVQPRLVYTVHGFSDEFARELRRRGVEAWPLGKSNQLELPIAVPAGLTAISPVAAPVSAAEEPAGPNTGSFGRFAAAAEAVKAQPGKLAKRATIAALLRELDPPELGWAALFFTGRAFPQSAGRTLNLGAAVIRRAVMQACDQPAGAWTAAYHRFSDTGETVEALLASCAQTTEPWSLNAAAGLFERLAAERSPVGKIESLAEQLRRLTPGEAKYLVKIITGDLRIGLKDGLVEEALAEAFAQPLDEVKEANLRCGDIARTAEAAKANRLEALELAVFNPLQFMLASPEPDAAAIIARLGPQVWLEEKYDGIRCQAHRAAGRAELYSRDLRRITAQFPELAAALAALPADLIADGELLAWRDGRALPFAELQKRLGRQGEDFFLGEEIPVSLWFYDLLWLNGRSLLKTPLSERRALLESLPLSGNLAIAPRQIASGSEAIDAAFLAARRRGNEGLMAKDPASHYTPGRRGLAWLKLKKAYATLDVVVVGAEYGHGKRREVLSDYTFAVRDEDTGALRVIGKAYTGLMDAEIATLTERFLESALEQRGRYFAVPPEVVLEIAFDTIQASQRHDSGFALRFPRIVRIRDDKLPTEIDTLETCRRLAAAASAGFESDDLQLL
jgi:DNA ligase 1